MRLDLFAGPMFDPTPVRDGPVPVAVLVLGVGLVLAVIGLAAMLRITRVEGEPRSFRATTHREPTTTVVLAGAVIFALAAIAIWVATGG